MEYKYWSWLCVCLCILLNIFGFYWLFVLFISMLCFALGTVTIVYLHHTGEKHILEHRKSQNLAFDQDDPLHALKALGLNLETTTVPANYVDREGSSQHGANATDEHYKWKLFDSIKIHTDKRRSVDPTVDVHVGEECGAPQVIETTPIYKLHNDSAVLDQHGSPKKKFRSMLSGNKQIDQLLHTIINYILRDFIDSWFFSLSDNKEFSEFRTRNCIEESVQNVCTRVKGVQWIPLITTKLVDIVAMHARLYRKANTTLNLQLDETKSTSSSGSNQSSFQTNNSSPQRRPSNAKKMNRHRRNKSETDLNLGNQRTFGNSKFYDSVDQGRKKSNNDKSPVGDAGQAKLITAFFNQCELYREECLDDEALEDYLTRCMETVLYFTIPEEDFACIPLRMFLSTLLANVVCKPVIDMLSEPDFINLQVAKSLTKEPPSSEIFLRLLRQCDDASELRAVRQLITKEMDAKYKDPNASAEMSSLKYAQKMIDLRLSYMQNNRRETDRDCNTMANLPIIPLDELLNKELTLSYYLDYLSVLNLQRYVIFYLSAKEWKATVVRYTVELQSNKLKGTRDDVIKLLRNKASNIHKEYLEQSSANALNIDSGLIETLNIRLNDVSINPDPLWFESICKYVYEKIKNEDVFLSNFYISTQYRKLLLELEFLSNFNVDGEIDSNTATQLLMNARDESSVSVVNSTMLNQCETGSDSNSGDLMFDDEIDFIALDGNGSDFLTVNTGQKVSPIHQVTKASEATEKTGEMAKTPESNLLDIIGAGVSKHYRSHSDCTGLIQNIDDIRIEPLTKASGSSPTNSNEWNKNKSDNEESPKHVVAKGDIHNEKVTLICPQHRLSAKILNTAINCEGQFAVYAIQVTVIEDDQQKSWHVYRRYSRFLDLKKVLVKRFPSISQIPFPAKKTFQNTQRSVLEHRMTLLNEFLKTISMRADDNDELNTILRDFLEPDTNDKKIHGGAVIRTIETIVNPFKSGMRTIKNMPDTLVGGMARILLGKGPTKETAFLDVTPIHLEHSSEYPALTSALNLLDEVFDLQARSQWLRRGLINRLLGAPWVSQAANKRITQATKAAIELEKIENVLSIILNTIWPDGKRSNQTVSRDENTKLRTRMAAKVALFTLLADDLKHVVGSETTRYGLLNSFSMWQHKTLNKRLVLVLFNELLTTLYQTDDLTKHVK
ncbi:sorting nexin-13 isoform X2 [Sitodiplosis mosellana]|uniref:sorting nexin-13 isoform X2 n=1 Tax=Sitodiplosis mosellana TaxID=263140 RepID=UPI002444D150|nr:sorting nexin-13 isoform X2 [Sitodiplosis mosellana]